MLRSGTLWLFLVAFAVGLSFRVVGEAWARTRREDPRSAESAASEGEGTLPQKARREVSPREVGFGSDPIDGGPRAVDPLAQRDKESLGGEQPKLPEPTPEESHREPNYDPLLYLYRQAGAMSDYWKFNAPIPVMPLAADRLQVVHWRADREDWPTESPNDVRARIGTLNRKTRNRLLNMEGLDRPSQVFAYRAGDYLETIPGSFRGGETLATNQFAMVLAGGAGRQLRDLPPDLADDLFWIADGFHIRQEELRRDIYRIVRPIITKKLASGEEEKDVALLVVPVPVGNWRLIRRGLDPHLDVLLDERDRREAEVRDWVKEVLGQ